MRIVYHSCGTNYASATVSWDVQCEPWRRYGGHGIGVTTVTTVAAAWQRRGSGGSDRGIGIRGNGVAAVAATVASASVAAVAAVAAAWQRRWQRQRRGSGCHAEVMGAFEIDLP
jgi:hypothetical protein